MNIVILALPQVLDMSLALSANILQTANSLQSAMGKPATFRATVVGYEIGMIRTGAGLGLQISHTLNRRRVPDLIVVPGAYVTNAPAMEAWLSQPWIDEVCRYLRAMVSRGAHVAASCAGTYLLAHAGILENRRATTTWWLSQDFRTRFPTVSLVMKQMIVEDGPCTTAGAALAHADLMLNIVARFGGASLARLCGRYLLLDERIIQTRYAVLQHLSMQDGAMRKAEAWVRKNLSKSFDVPTLANALHLTPRTFARRCRSTLNLSPMQFVQRIRAEVALNLLQTSNVPTEQIAAQVGYLDLSAFRRLLLRQTGRSPAEIRRTRDLSAG